MGELIALTYVLTLEDPQRFRRSRDVGGYLGLRPADAELFAWFQAAQSILRPRWKVGYGDGRKPAENVH